MRWKTAKGVILSISFGLGAVIVITQAWDNLNYILLLIGVNMIPIIFFVACAYGLSRTHDTSLRVILLLGGIASGVSVFLVVDRIMDFSPQMAFGSALMNASILFTREVS
jgi:hypothetical protein